MQATSLTIEFDPAIEHNGQAYHSIELREPRMRELERAYSEVKTSTDAQSLIRFQIALVCAVTGQPKQVIELMSVSQMNEAFNYLQNFMNGSTGTGAE